MRHAWMSDHIVLNVCFVALFNLVLAKPFHSVLKLFSDWYAFVSARTATSKWLWPRRRLSTTQAESNGSHQQFTSLPVRSTSSTSLLTNRPASWNSALGRMMVFKWVSSIRCPPLIDATCFDRLFQPVFAFIINLLSNVSDLNLLESAIFTYS